MLRGELDKFRLKSVMSCNSFNAIYVAFCLGCLEEYVVRVKPN